MGKLIVIESSDGAGKSTQSKIIESYLRDLGKSVAFYHFPMYGHNKFSELISRFLRGEFGSIKEVSPYFVANLYAMDRFMFLPELKKSLEENDVVLLDRYVLSNIAYQSAKYPFFSEESISISKWIEEFEFNFLGLPVPDLNILLDIPTSITRTRLMNKREGADREYLEGGKDIHEEDHDFQGRVRAKYLDYMAGREKCFIVSCVSENGYGDYDVLDPYEIFINYENEIDKIL